MSGDLLELIRQAPPPALASQLGQSVTERLGDRFGLRVARLARQRLGQALRLGISNAAPPDLPASLFIVDLEPGDERSGDLTVARSPAACPQPRTPPLDPAATSAIRGRITAAGGGPLARATVRL